MTRMIERWFPCQAVSEESDTGWGSGRTEKALFTWFAARPSAQARAAVLCSLLPWPDEPREQVRLQALVRSALTERDASQHELVAELARHYPAGARVLDPFSGRAMIPLEAARLGLDSHAIDYSPVATLAGALLADYPFRDWSSQPEVLPGEDQDFERNGVAAMDTRPRLVRDVDKVLAAIGRRHAEDVDEYFPATNGARPWGYLWAVSLPCQECGNRFPLVANLSLRTAIKRAPRGRTPGFEDPGQSFRIRVDDSGQFYVDLHDGSPIGTPTLVNAVDPSGRKIPGKSAVCPNCNHVHPLEVHRRLTNEGSGKDELLLVSDHHPVLGKYFRLPTAAERDAAAKAEFDLAQEPEIAPMLPAVPDEGIAPGNNNIIGPSIYGARTFGDMCVPRQTLAFIRLSKQMNRLASEMLDDGVSPDYAHALIGYAASTFVRCLRYSTRGAWLRSQEKGAVSVAGIFINEGSLTFSYDNFEVGIGGGGGSWDSSSRQTVQTLEKLMPTSIGRRATVSRGSAVSLAYPDGRFDAVVTDPPYDEMIAYCDSSDLFYAWLKRMLYAVDPGFSITSDAFGAQEKTEEIIVKRSRGLAKAEVKDHRTREHYDSLIATSFAQMRRVTADGGVVTIVFGHGEPEVWHRLLGAVSTAGLVLTGSWPARTESGGQQGKANIETTLTLACRPASPSRPSGRVSEVDEEVRREIISRIPLWDAAGLALTDQLMASAGPAMEVVGRYAVVHDKAGQPVDLDRYLPLARRYVEEAADIKVDTLPLETFDHRTRFALFWVRLYGRGTAAASEARWQRLASDLSEEDTAGLIVKSGKGVRFAFAAEADLNLSPQSPVVDVALAVAAAGKSVASVAEVLVRVNRTEDPFVWGAMGELSRMVPEADLDGDVWTWVVRNRGPITGATRNVEAAKTREEHDREAASRQATLFEGED